MKYCEFDEYNVENVPWRKKGGHFYQGTFDEYGEREAYDKRVANAKKEARKKVERATK